jgi:pyrroloquinoline quinone (PQQ) biosynthesis protein C
MFFKNWAAYTIEINTLEAATYHKHIHFFRKHRDLMAAMAQKLADELVHPKPPGHIHVVLETAKALGIAEDDVFVSPMLAEFRAKIDYFRAIVWEGTMAEFYAAGATEERFGYWAGEVFNALTRHYGLTAKEAVYFRCMKRRIRASMRTASWATEVFGAWCSSVCWRTAPK